MTVKRLVVAVLASIVCCWAIWQAARVGLARTFAEKAVPINQVDADRAIFFSPNDAETHTARGDVMQVIGEYEQARIEFERAVQLRPRDYYLWLMLGVMRDQNHDQDGALRALRQAEILAPAYAQPRWQLGNLLLRMGRVDDAFAELRKAALSDPVLLPNVIDLAWGVYGHDVQAVLTVLQPERDEARLALALFFAQNNQARAAVDQFLLTKTASEAKGEALLGELLKARAFSEAYHVWERVRGIDPANAISVVRDGGFESSIAVGQPGFGWQITPNISNVLMSVDAGEHHGGARSLRIDFRGDSNPQVPFLTQLVLVKPQTHYRLTFAAMSKEFVSAAAPMVTVTDASDQKNVVLAQSPPLGSNIVSWRDFAVEFTTNSETQAIAIAVSRQSCHNDPCPAFGAVWLDSFSIEARTGEVARP